jgi:O-phospho-L-seryl-tRNASec:L-selenocysteinyl-tRNA synthase
MASFAAGVSTGGAIVLSPHKEVVERVGRVYAGRASSAPSVDLFITLLSMGLDGYKQLLQERARLVPLFRAGLAEVAEKHGERMLDCDNSISFGITLDALCAQPQLDEGDKELEAAAAARVTKFGAMLFHRCVSGTRVVAPNELKKVGGTEFRGYGSSTDDYPHAYLTAACAIGLTEPEMREFFRRLDKTFAEFKKKQHKQAGA